MPTTREYVTQPVPTSPYRVDGRATILSSPLSPYSGNVHGGPHVGVVSGVRDNKDIWPSASGTVG